jgi:hypothetical protein
VTAVQSELFEASPARRVIVPTGYSAFWGVDVSTKAVSVGWATAGRHKAPQRGVVTISWPAQDGGQRLAVAYRTIAREVVTAIGARRLPMPGLIWVEQPGGKSINWPLAYMVGIAQAAVCGALETMGFSAVRCETVAPSLWKKRACGHGAIPKTDPETRKPWRDPFGYGVLRWARDAGYDGTSWDEADGLGIAEAARRSVVLEER